MTDISATKENKGRFQIVSRRDWDVLAILITTPLLIIAVYLVPDTFLRVIFGLPFILFFPGYVTVLALFPEKEDLEPIERIALSFGLSIAIAPLIGFGLNYTPLGIRLTPILACLSIFNVVVALVGLYRRNGAIDPYKPFDIKATYHHARIAFKQEKGADKALTIILVISIIAAVCALAYVVAFPRQGESFTEFYLLGPEGKAENYPSELVVGQVGTVIVGIANHEHRTVKYTVEVWLVNASYVDNAIVVNQMYYINQFGPTLDHVEVDTEGTWTAQWESAYQFNLNVTGEYKLWFLLFKDEVPALPTGIPLVPMQDFTGTIAEERITMAVENDIQSLNLNLRIT